MPQRQAIVEVTLNDGSRLTERVEAVRGTAENPMTRDEVVRKCRDLTAPVLGAAVADRLIQTVLTLEQTAGYPLAPAAPPAPVVQTFRSAGSAGLKACTDCRLPTADCRLPTGRL